jgi:hypothetical protein
MQSFIQYKPVVWVGLGFVIGILLRPILIPLPKGQHSSTGLPISNSRGTATNLAYSAGERIHPWRSIPDNNGPHEQPQVHPDTHSDSTQDPSEDVTESLEKQRMRTEAIGTTLAELTPHNESKYATLLKDLTISDRDKGTVLRRVKETQEAALQLTAAIQNFRESQLDFDLRMRRFLSEEDYKIYRSREQGRAAKNELDAIMTFATARGSNISEQDASALTASIQANAAYTLRKELTPYLDFPDIQVESPLDAVRSMREQATSHQQRASLVIESLQADGVDPKALEVVSGYFAEKIKRLETMAARLEADLAAEARRGTPMNQ